MKYLWGEFSGRHMAGTVDLSAQVRLVGIDWLIIVVYFSVVLLIGLWSAKRAQKNSEQFFLSGRSMPWWLLGASMVATTFSTDTPNLVTDIVRQHGVAGNWMWWAFLPTGMLTVFIYARLWRKSGVMTDVEFYEIRYSGKSAAFLRGFRALYLGVFFNVMIMGTVTLAAIKIGGVMLGLSPLQTILIASVVTVIFCTFGGFEGVLLTDFVLFGLAMAGSVVAAIVSLKQPAVGGLKGLLAHSSVQGKLLLLPAFDFSTTDKMNLVMTVFLVPIAVQWWSVWYPGSEPGGGGISHSGCWLPKLRSMRSGRPCFLTRPITHSGRGRGLLWRCVRWWSFRIWRRCVRRFRMSAKILSGMIWRIRRC